MLAGFGCSSDFVAGVLSMGESAAAGAASPPSFGASSAAGAGGGSTLGLGLFNMGLHLSSSSFFLSLICDTVTGGGEVRSTPVNLVQYTLYTWSISVVFATRVA